MCGRVGAKLLSGPWVSYTPGSLVCENTDIMPEFTINVTWFRGCSVEGFEEVVGIQNLGVKSLNQAKQNYRLRV